MPVTFTKGFRPPQPSDCHPAAGRWQGSGRLRRSSPEPCMSAACRTQNIAHTVTLQSL